MKKAFWSAVLVLVLAAAAPAQEKKPELPPNLGLTAVGRHHHPITTKSREAQDYFDQGFTFLYGFNHEEAIRAFRKAAELDPASPMPLWGIAFAAGPNYNAPVNPEAMKMAFATISQAQKLAAAGAPAERDYVAAMAARYSGEAKPDFQKLSNDFAAAMKALSGKYPDDLDAATLYAESMMDLKPWKLWTSDGKPAEGTLEIERVLESVLARDPLHAGANHYYIHAVEASPRPDRALPSARRLDTMVPQAGHLVHMPAHIYNRTGEYAAAAKSNELAAEIDKKYAVEAEKQGSMYDMMYHSHNEHFLAMAASTEGRYETARAAAGGMEKRLAPHALMMPMLDVFLMSPIWVDARFGKWDAILARPEPSKELLGTHGLWRYARAVALAQKGQPDQAEAERALFTAEAAKIAPHTPLDNQNYVDDVLAVAAHVMEARIAAARGRHDEAITHWRAAVGKEEALNYMEPADWYYPVRESLGAALLRSGKAAEAEKVFREDLVRNPRNPRSLFGLAESLKAQKKTEDAAWVERQFQAGWKNADTQLKIAEF